MKNIILASVATAAFSTAAVAGELGGHAYSEYALEAEAFEFGVGAIYYVDALTFGVEGVLVKESGADLAFDSVEISSGLVLSENVGVYGAVSFDGDLEYQDTTVGIRVEF